MDSKTIFKRIALMGRHHPERIQSTLRALHDFLTARGYPVVYDEHTAEKLDFQTRGIPVSGLNRHCDLLIVVGGDGSLLQAAQVAVDQSLPVLGVNRGRLGFLTDIYPSELTVVEEVLQGRYEEEERFLLECGIQRQNVWVETIAGLNEIILSPGNVGHMIEFEVLANERLICDLRADGLIVATPTGSTAYALSGGGPILDPCLNAMVLVPMFPHTLSNRPLVIDANMTLTIQLAAHQRMPFVSADGQPRIALCPEDKLFIRKKERLLRLIHPCTYEYFHTLRTKLRWQSSSASSH